MSLSVFVSAGWFSDLFRGKITGKATDDVTPRVSFWQGKVNQHTESGVWMTDPDGSSGAELCDTELERITYCKKFYGDGVTASPEYMIETIDFCTARNADCTYTSTRQTYECVSGEAGPVCGNNIKETGEECDDGNTANDDGCSSVCTIEAVGGCGNGTKETGEECDDGNTVSGDGCSSTCTIEAVGGCGDGTCNINENCGTCIADCPCEGYGWSCLENVCALPRTCEKCIALADPAFSGSYWCGSENICRELPGGPVCTDLGSVVDIDTIGGCPATGGCIDTDKTATTYSDGKNYFEPGETIGADSIKKTDECQDSTYIIEWYCGTDGSSASETIKCDYGCEEKTITVFSSYSITGGACVIGTSKGLFISKEECTTGCYLDEKCYNIGTRKSGDYCGEDLDFVAQKEAEATCEDNFECLSNVCLDGSCIKANIWQKFLNWFRAIFGGGDKKNLVADDFRIEKDGLDVSVLLNYDEIGLSESDNYWTSFSSSFDNGETFDRSSFISREALKLNGFDIELDSDFEGMGVEEIIVRARMDSMTEEDIAHHPEIADEFIEETNEQDNCIQQRFKVLNTDLSPEQRDFIAIGDVEECVGEETTDECTDSDADEKWYAYVKGTVTVGGKDYPDKCGTGGVIEAVCKNGEEDTENIFCALGCKDGACISEKGCKDDDVTNEYSDGINPYQKGKLTDDFGTNFAIGIREDECVFASGVKLVLLESFCDEDARPSQPWNSKQIECPNGCVDGACVPEGITVGCTDTDPTNNDVIGQYPYGENYTVRGTTTSGVGYAGTDVCSSPSGLLHEYYCGTLGEGKETLYKCEDDGMICYEGACVSEETSICTDTDPTNSDVTGQYPYGKNIYKKGLTTVGTNTKPDTCFDTSKVIENYCLDEDTGNTELIDCPSGYTCDEGACFEGPTILKEIAISNPGLVLTSISKKDVDISYPKLGSKTHCRRTCLFRGGCDYIILGGIDKNDVTTYWAVCKNGKFFEKAYV